MTDVPMFDLGDPQPPAPTLSADARRTVQQKRMLAAGRHPATKLPLLTAGQTCGDCTHAHRHEGGARNYWKCDLHRLGESRSSASDIRVGWPACERFAAHLPETTP